MIEAIRTASYDPYNRINANSDSTVYKTQDDTSALDMQEVLKSLGEYVYSESDMASVDEELIDGLKNKFNIDKKDIYKLKKNGYDLERLYMEDMSYYTGFQSTQGALGDYNTTYASSKTAQIENKIDVIKKQNDTMYLNALYSDKPITINSLYQNNFKGSFKKTNASYTEEDINKVLQMNGLSNTKGNMWAARKLAEYGVDINKQDVVKLQNMKAAVECLEEQEEIQKAQEDLADGRIPGERPLMKDDKVLYDYQDVKDIKEDLGKIEEADIEELIESDEEITIGNLRATLFKNTDLALKRSKPLSFTEGQKKIVEDIKEQIHQIRAKLTTEAAQKISEKMPLESSQLSDVANELTAIENEKIQEAVKEAGIELTDENAGIIRNVIQVRQEILENKEQVAGTQAATNEKALLSEIHDAISKYGQNETPVEVRFGENINRVASQIEGLLEDLGISKPSQEMVQAAKALIMNDMEISEDNVRQTLEIMSKINTFIEEMTPNRTAVLIKEGLNPYAASIDTLLDWISKGKIEELKSSVAETIVALEEKGIVNSEQKDALLGFYRIMQSVSKNREEVVGYLFKNNLPLTIEKLQEAAKYAGTEGIIEAAIDDSFGEITDLKYTSQTAKMMLEISKEQIAKSIDIVSMLEKMALPVNEESIDKLKKINALLYPIIKENFKKEFGKFEGMETLPKSFLEKIEAVKTVAPKVVSYMLKEGIAPTVSNIYWTDKIIKNPDTYKELLKEGGFLKEDLPKSFEAFEEELNHQEEQAAKNKDEALEKGNIIEYRTYKHIQEVVHLQKELSQKDGVYQIPFLIQGEEKMVHLYFNQKGNIKGDNSRAVTAVMTYETEHIGVVTAYISFKEDTIGYRIQGETREITSRLQGNSDWLDDFLNEIGYAVKYSEYQTPTTEGAETDTPSLIKRGDSSFEEII
jgi:hypothetical protein